MNTTTINEPQIKDKIRKIIAAKPNCFIQHIADVADCDIDDLNVPIAQMVAAGEIISEKRDAPNGLKAFAYRINTSSLNWRAPGKGVQALAPKPDEVPTLTKVQKAISYIKLNGSATTDDLRRAMDIPAMYSPTQYLKSALKNHSLVRDGDTWKIGNNQPTTDQKFKAPRQTTFIQLTKAEVPIAAPTSIQIAADNVVSSLIIGSLRIAEWSRGNLVISANDESINLLPEQAAALKTFLKLTGA